MSSDPNNTPPQISYEDRARWEKGTYFPPSLSEELTGMLKGLAWDTDNAEEQLIKNLKVDFYTGKHWENSKPVYHIHITGYKGLPAPFNRIVTELYDYAKENYPDDVAWVDKADGGRDNIQITAGSIGLKPAIDILFNGFIKKHSQNDPDRYKLNFEEIMKEAAAKVPDGVKVKKIWHDTIDGMPLEGQDTGRGAA